MASYTDKFRLLVDTYRDAPIPFLQLKPVTVAQWMHESGRGSSKLATDHNNFAGLKWRDEMQGFATPVTYEAHDGTDRYCKFTSIETFIPGYWHFLERAPYRGWRDHAASGVDFMDFIGPIYTPTAGYATAVEGLIPEAEALLASAGNITVLSITRMTHTDLPSTQPNHPSRRSSPARFSRAGMANASAGSSCITPPAET